MIKGARRLFGFHCGYPKFGRSTGSFLIFIALAITGCVSKPTKVVEEFKYRSEVRLKESTVVLDVRSALDFNSARIPGSQSVSWEEFTSKAKPNTTFLLTDLDRLTARLARLGITPDTEVLVVGNGPQGNGEEGRLAWTLYYLGITKVKVSTFSTLTGVKLVADDSSPQPQPKPFWKADLKSKTLAAKKEVLDIVTGKVLRRGEKAFLIDVRTETEYKSRKNFGGDYTTPNIEALNIPWTEFFSPDGQVNMALKSQLAGVGVTPDIRVVVISNRGVRSAAVTMALISMGFENAANYVGGFNDLVKK